MDAAKIAAIGIVAGILAVSVKKTNPEMALHVSIAAGLLILLMVVEYIATAVDFVRELAAKHEGAMDGISIVLKIIAIGYICEFAVQILRDGGENAIAAKVETAGKVIIMVITLPLLQTFAQLVMSLL